MASGTPRLKAEPHASSRMARSGTLIVLIAEIPDVFGEKVHAQAAAELDFVGHLAMLQCVAVIEARMACLRLLNRVECGFGGLFAIDMLCICTPSRCRQNHLLVQKTGRRVPDEMPFGFPVT